MLHRFVGAGVAALLLSSALTGSLLAFESELEAAFERDARRLPRVGDRPLAPPELFERIRQQLPKHRVVRLELGNPVREAAVVRVEPVSPTRNEAPRQGRQLERRFVDPYTGDLSPPFDGAVTQLFRWLRSMHRWLALDALDLRALGKRAVGLSTLLLIGMVVSGLVLHHRARWRARMDFWRARGLRARWWNLHAMLGSLAAVLYLWFAATGLYWSFELYRERVDSISGVDAFGVDKSGVEAQRRRDASEPRRSIEKPSASKPDLAAAWDSVDAVFARVRIDWTEMSIWLPRAADSVIQFRYLDAGAEHSRAMSMIHVDGRTGTVLAHDRYADRPRPARWVSSMFALHSGSYFGWAGRSVALLASASLGVVALSGVRLLLLRSTRARRHPDRRNQER